MRNAIRLLCGVVMLVVLPMTGLTKGDDAAIAREGRKRAERARLRLSN